MSASFVVLFEIHRLPLAARGVLFDLLDISIDYDGPVRVPNLPGYLIERAGITAAEWEASWPWLAPHWCVDGPWIVAPQIGRA